MGDEVRPHVCCLSVQLWPIASHDVVSRETLAPLNMVMGTAGCGRHYQTPHFIYDTFGHKSDTN